MGHYSFHKDLKRSVKEEKSMVARLCEFYPAIKEIKDGNKDSKYDYKVVLKNGKSIFIEQKNDYMSVKTGNIAIEFESRGKKSGINRSMAAYYLIVSGPDTIFIATNRLRRLIKDQEYSRISEWGGDRGSNTKNYLFKKEVIVSNGKLLFTKEK